jgi:DNA-binding CsgD family transcriptional regulator
MFTESRLLQVIEGIYEAAVDCADLDRLAHTLARAFETDSALVVMDEMPNGTSALPPTLAVPSTTENFDANARLAYAQYYHDINIWLREGLKNPLPAIVLCGELVDETTLQRHEWFDYCRQTGMFHCLGAAFAVGDNVMAEIGIHRWQSATPLVADDKRKMAQLLPHLQRALTIQHRFGVLEHRRALALDVLENLAVAVIIVDAKARVLFANEVAERELRAQSGLTSLPELQRLVRACSQTSAGNGTSAGGVIMVERIDGIPLLLSIAPLRARGLGFGPSQPAAIITFSDPRVRPIDESTLVRAYGLTRSEARLASALAAGVSLAEHAQRERTTTATARTHLKHIFEKTGWRRQADLVRALASPVLQTQKHTNAT